MLAARGAALGAGALRPRDFLARYGGEEFVLVLDACGRTQALEVAERIRESIESLPFVGDGKTFNVTASVGVATVDTGAWLSPDTLLACADRALYESKRAGRNRVSFASI